jgi:Ca2+-binding RTX toxin-like protein
LTTESSDQEGPTPEQVAASDRDGAPTSPSNPNAADAAIVRVVQSLLDGQDEGATPPPLPQQNAAGLGDLPFFVVTAAAPLETAAGPSAGAIGGGASHYDSDFGTVVAGLQRNANGGVADGTATPGGFAALIAADDAGLPLFAQVIVPGGADNPDTGTGGDDTGTGGDTGSGGDDLPALFTAHSDSVDFNDVEAGSYLDGTQYDADNQDDFVILPSDADAAAEAGFVAGTLFLAGNGNDSVFGGTLADLIDGGNGQDLLDGGAGDDTLIGGNAADTLIGGLGDDVMTGGEGKDVFAYSLSANEGNDRIIDFTAGKGGDTLQISGLLDVSGDGKIDVADLDAGGHSVSGTADAVVITFDSGTSITLDGIDGTGIDSFADLVSSAKVNVDIL